MLYLFDLDGTLISSYMDSPGRNYHSWQVLPCRIERLRQIIADGHQVAVITNQGGVGAGFTALDDARHKLRLVAEALGFPGVALHEYAGAAAREYSTSHWGADSAISRRSLPVFVCYAGPQSDGPMGRGEGTRRKPSGAMLIEACGQMGLGMSYDEAADALIDEDALMVGDRPEDMQAAQAAGVAFVWADAFFG